MTAVWIVITVVLVLLVAPVVGVLACMVIHAWLDFLFLGKFRGRQVWRGLAP